MTIPLDPGILIAVEGIDGAGKTTQVGILERRLKDIGFDVTRSKEPTNGPWGQKIRLSASNGRMSADKELEAFIEDRREHVKSFIQPSLKNGSVVLLDRYYFSSAAYQGARGLDPTKIIEINEAFAPVPDLVVILDVSPAVGISRVNGRGDSTNEFERKEALTDVSRVFATFDRPDISNIDGEQDIDKVTWDIFDALLKGPLFRRFCSKRHYKNECEPAYCTERVSGECLFPKMGSLAPLDPALVSPALPK